MSDKFQKLCLPRSKNNLKITVNGIFAYPEEWKTTDEANPGIFTYAIKISDVEITGGKINPRQLSEKQLREQQQSKKKGGKKQAKKQQNPADTQKLKQQQQREEQQERRKQEQWKSMSEQQQFHSASEDSFKSALLKFQTCTVQKQMTGKKLVIFEERALKDGGIWVYVYKFPTANEEQLAKMKKSKPKNLNLADLYPITMRTWLDISELKSQTNSKILGSRCKLQQVDKTQQTPQPNLAKTYIKISIQLDQPIVHKKDQYSKNQVISDPPKKEAISADIQCVNQLKNQLRIAMESLAMEYSAMFSKELNFLEQQKTLNVFVNNRKNQHTKRKQQFLYDFNVTGKYKILKERLKKNIVHLCQSKFKDKMGDSKSFTGITCSVRDQFYSEIYNFLVASYSQTFADLVGQMKQKLQEVQVLNPDSQKIVTQKRLNKYKYQAREDRIVRNINEYKLVGNLIYGQRLFAKQISEDPNPALKYQYSIYCLKNGIKTAKDPLILKFVQDYLSHHKQELPLQIFYVLLLLESQDKQMQIRAWIILRQLINEIEQKQQVSEKQDDEASKQSQILPYIYAYLLFEQMGNKQLGQKFFQLAARRYLRINKRVNVSGSHQQNPHTSEIPTIANVATFQQELTAEELDKIWLSACKTFAENRLQSLTKQCMQKIKNKDNIEYKKIEIGVLMAEKNYEQLIDCAQKLYKETKEASLISDISRCYSILGQYEDAQKYLKISLKVSDQKSRINTLFLLGKLFIDTKKYGNAKACFIKYLQLAKQCCGGLSWQLLGNNEGAIQSLRHANLNDPNNSANWLLLTEIYIKIGNYNMVNQCFNSFEGLKQGDGLEQEDRDKINGITQILKQSSGINYYQQSIQNKFSEKLKVYVQTN